LRDFDWTEYRSIGKGNRYSACHCAAGRSGRHDALGEHALAIGLEVRDILVDGPQSLRQQVVGCVDQFRYALGRGVGVLDCGKATRLMQGSDAALAHAKFARGFALRGQGTRRSYRHISNIYTIIRLYE
jgi:hypothetical protein